MSILNFNVTVITHIFHLYIFLFEGNKVALRTGRRWMYLISNCFNPDFVRLFVCLFVCLGFEDPSNHWTKRITNIRLAT